MLFFFSSNDVAAITKTFH